MGFDLKAPFGSDIQLLGQGEVDVLGARSLDFNFTSARDELIQRIIRRLCTTKGEWIIFPEYGAGLRAYIDQPASFDMLARMKAEIKLQLSREADIETSPSPEVKIDLFGSTLSVYIKVLTKSVGIVAFSFDPQVV